MLTIYRKENFKKHLIRVSIVINLIFFILVFTPLKLQTARQYSESFVPKNIKVTNTLLHLIEKNNVPVTRAELVAALVSSNDRKNILSNDELEKNNSFGTLHFSLAPNSEVVNRVWIEIPTVLPEEFDIRKWRGK